MRELICAHCTKELLGNPNEAVWIPLKTFIVSWRDDKPYSILYFYDCPHCGGRYTVSMHINQDN